METLQNKIDTLLEQGIAPTVAIVRVGEDETCKAFETRAQEVGNAFAVAIEKFIFPEISDETDVMDVLEVIYDDPMLHALILLLPLPEKMDERRIRSMLNPTKDIEGLDWGALAGTDYETMQKFLEAVVDSAVNNVAEQTAAEEAAE